MEETEEQMMARFAEQRAAREAIMAANPPIVDCAHSANAYFDWAWKGCGFGQFSFSVNDGVWSCGTEGMKPETTRKLLHAFADYVADQLKPVIEAEQAARNK